MERFLRTCGPLTTKKQYSNAIQLYLRWLREEKGVTMNPDELMLDNLRCIFESKATDVTTKRKHTDLLDEYINGYLLDKKGQSETARGVKAAAIKGLYRVNDSLLFGHFSLTKQAPVAPDKPLLAEDIRQVLKTLPAHARAPLLCVWQGGIEIEPGALDEVEGRRGGRPERRLSAQGGVLREKAAPEGLPHLLWKRHDRAPQDNQGEVEAVQRTRAGRRGPSSSLGR